MPMCLPVGGRQSALQGRRRRGVLIVWLLILLAMIIGIVAIGLDGGRMLEKRRHVQAAADAAALSAAAELCDSNFYNRYRRWRKTKREAKFDALAVADANGFKHGVNSTVTVNIPPKSGEFTGAVDCAEVIIQYNMPNTFGRIFNKNNMPVKARAVAIGRPLRMGLILLRQTGADAFRNNSLVGLVLLNGRIYVNSSDPAAFNHTKGLLTANSYDVVGGYLSGGVMLGKMNTGVRPIADPLRELPVPDPATLPVQKAAFYNPKGLLTTIQPGVYRGGIKLETLLVLMDPGIYYVEGGGFEVGPLTTLVSVGGVTIYNTAGTTPAGPITVKGAALLTAPTTGTYQGINVFQDRSVSQPFSLQGLGLTQIFGLIYAPAADVNLTAVNPLSILGGGYIVNSMQVNGAVGVNISFGGNPPIVPEIALVE